jgi:polyisoprenyl-phosphate glycosyltransferase
MAKISIIIPYYFNEDNIPVTTARLIESETLFPKEVEFEYVLVDDGSKDGTLERLQGFKSQYPSRVKVVKLTGNFGSYNAIYAGLLHATGDCMVVISADLQDPPELIVKMYEHWQKGMKVVLANRAKRDDGILNVLFSNWYHSVIRKYALPNLPSGGFDFCLFDSEVREHLLENMETNTNSLFLILLFKYEFVTIPYERSKREIGKSRWTTSKKIRLLIDSFFSFSYAPIRVVSAIGILLSVVAVLYALVIVVLRLTGQIELTGWSALMVVLLFLSAFQMVALGILGEYLWRSLEASRKRPPFIVDKVF